MTFDKKGKHHISSRDYAYARELINLIPISEETRKKHSVWQKGRHLSEEHKINLSKVWKGRKHSEKSKEKQRNSKLEEKNPMFGKISHNRGKKQPCTEEQRKNLSIAAKNVPKKECEYCHIILAPHNYIKYHGEKCKNKI